MTAKKETQKRARERAGNKTAKGRKPINPRAPWRASWWVLWGLITAVAEILLIFLQKGKVVSFPTLQLVVLVVCIPFVAHLLVSAFRTILIAISSR